MVEKYLRVLDHDFEFEDAHVEEKEWGYCYTIFRSAAIKQTLNIVEEGGYCSVHEHKVKTNRFVRVAGELNLDIFDPHSQRWFRINVDHTKNYKYDILPGNKHRFYCPVETLFLETEYAIITDKDIYRIQGGGVSDGQLGLPTV